MAITARYTDPEHTMIEANIHGQVWSGVRFTNDGEINRMVYDWVNNDGGVITDWAPPAGWLEEHVAQKRREMANGSVEIDVGGGRLVPVWVEPESRGSILGLFVALSLVPELTTVWKGADGEFYDLNAAEITALALGMMNYVQAAFAAEKTILEGIAAQTITSLTEIDDAIEAAKTTAETAARG